MSSFRSSCEQVLRANDRGRHTVPSGRLYPHQWAWDSAFAAIGWAHVDPARAWLELRTLMEGQWPDGRIPHIVFHDLSGEYFPGPELWGAERSSTISQPPVWATAARRIVEVAGMDDAVVDLLPAFDASHRFFHAARDPLGWDLVAVSHPWESGLDNCPAWDRPLTAVDVSAVPPFRRVDKDVVGDASMRPTDEEYLRYVALVRAIAEESFGPGPFAVYDPLFSALLARAEDDLAWLGERVGRATEAASRAASIRSGLMSHLWDADRGRFLYLDARSGQPITCDVIGCYMPLCAGIDGEPAARLREGLRKRFWTRWPLPSTAPGDPAFDPRRYWRGPTWVNTAWLLAPALGTELAERTVQLVREHGFREYYHPETGEGLGAEGFTWTAALALDLQAGLTG